MKCPERKIQRWVIVWGQRKEGIDMTDKEQRSFYWG
jgi:hypothetical protein